MSTSYCLVKILLNFVKTFFPHVTQDTLYFSLYDNFWFLLTKIVRAWNTFSTAIFPPILHIHSVEQMTIAVSNFSFIMSLMTFFDNESRGVAKPYYKSWKGGKGQKSISRIWRSCRAPISTKVLALKLKWNFQIRLYVHGKCLSYAHCTYFFHSVRKYFYLRTFGKRLTIITFVVILETNFFFASWTVKAHWTHFVRGKIRQQEKKSFSWVGTLYK